MNGQYLSSLGFILIRVALTMHGSVFKNRHFIRSHAKDSLKPNNATNRLKIILCYC